MIIADKINIGHKRAQLQKKSLPGRGKGTGLETEEAIRSLNSAESSSRDLAAENVAAAAEKEEEEAEEEEEEEEE